MEKMNTGDARQVRNAYYRAWRAKNPDKVKASNERYWLRRAEREAAVAEQESTEEVQHDEH